MTLESFLNLVWLVLSILLLVSLRGNETQPQRSLNARDSFQRYFTIILLSFLLLPVISMTDDVHAMTTMAEGERTYRKIGAAQNGHLQNPWLTHPAMAASLPPTGFHDACHGVVAAIELPGPTLRRFTKLLSDRAPPAR